jgi:hypothetical protein
MGDCGLMEVRRAAPEPSTIEGEPPPTRSFLRKQESSFFNARRWCGESWFPACAGMSGG